ncbi:MAG: hypothetical protein KDD62_02575 [Bdellovibrionales bacterium]|nr:hypothetical protein [Bdellovibrionales bacterium]
MELSAVASQPTTSPTRLQALINAQSVPTGRPNYALPAQSLPTATSLSSPSLDQQLMNFLQSFTPKTEIGPQASIWRSQASAESAHSGLQALSILFSQKDTASKIIELTQLGINSSLAQQVIGEVNTGYLNNAFALYQSISNWSSLSDEQRVTAVTQGLQGLSGLSSELGFNTGSSLSAGTSSIGSIAGVAGGVVGIVTGIDQASDVIDAIGDLPRSEAAEVGAIGLGTAGASIGAGIAGIGVATGAIAGAQAGSAVVPVVGTIIGAAVGALAGFAIGKFGSGKSKAQMMRDKWRESMEQTGVAKLIDGSHHVQLADGSTYNIGVDGSNKLQNLDGSERQTFDIDWQNSVATKSIPSAHIFAMATGLDPSIESEGLWHRAVGQALNAASSNANSEAEVTQNFRAMLGQTMDPRSLALKLEVLRTQNTIGEADYLVYLNSVNQMFNAQFLPTDKEKSARAVAQLLEQQLRTS